MRITGRFSDQDSETSILGGSHVSLVSSAHFAAAVVRGKSGWSASELDLSGVADVDEVADLLRDAEPMPRFRCSSSRPSTRTSPSCDSTRARICASSAPTRPSPRSHGWASCCSAMSSHRRWSIDEEVDVDAETDDKPAADPTVDPVGDADLLADLGVSAHKLLAAVCHRWPAARRHHRRAVPDDWLWRRGRRAT